MKYFGKSCSQKWKWQSFWKIGLLTENYGAFIWHFILWEWNIPCVTFSSTLHRSTFGILRLTNLFSIVWSFFDFSMVKTLVFSWVAKVCNHVSFTSFATFLSRSCNVANKCYIDIHLQPLRKICTSFENNVAATLLQRYSAAWVWKNFTNIRLSALVLQLRSKLCKLFLTFFRTNGENV